ncbi:hypothetical protein [Litoreibacter ponti]|nr:hypothetical protein [Litoreibacter ponti]
MKYLALAAALALPAPALAERIMTAKEFSDFVTGTTVYFERRGQPYGAEQYRSTREVIWTFLDGQCQRGTWFAERDEICFLYDGLPDAQCWHFIEDGDTRRARLVGDPPEDDLVVVGQDNQLLDCPGPDVGVSYTPVE